MADPPQRRPKSDEEEDKRQDSRIQQKENSGRVVVTGSGFESCDWKKKKWGREAC
jgi:hypothetical protein